MDPLDYYNDPSLQQAKQQSQTANQQYLDASKDAITLPDMLRDALNKKFTTNNPLISDMNNARVNAMNSMTSAPLSVLPENNNGIIFNPMQQADLINQQRNSALSPLMMLNDIFGQQVGGIQNLVDSAGKAFQGQVQGMENKATLAKDNYQTLLDEIKTKAQTTLTLAQLAETIRSNKANEEISRTNKSNTSSDKLTEKEEKRKADTAATWMDILVDPETGKQRTPNETWSIINRDKSAYGDAGIDVQRLWELQKEYADRTKASTPVATPEATSEGLTGALDSVPSWYWDTLYRGSGAKGIVDTGKGIMSLFNQ